MVTVALTLVVLLSGCAGPDLLRPVGDGEVIGIYPVVGTDETRSIRLTGNLRGGECMIWDDGGRSCHASSLKGARPGTYLDSHSAGTGSGMPTCGYWRGSLDVTEVLVTTPDGTTHVVEPLERSEELLDAHFFAACWSPGFDSRVMHDQVEGRTADGEPVPLDGSPWPLGR